MHVFLCDSILRLVQFYTEEWKTFFLLIIMCVIHSLQINYTFSLLSSQSSCCQLSFSIHGRFVDTKIQGCSSLIKNCMCVCICAWACHFSHVWLLRPYGVPSPPGYGGHVILQARIPEWVPTSSSRGSSRPRDWTTSLTPPALSGEIFTASTT